MEIFTKSSSIKVILSLIVINSSTIYSQTSEYPDHYKKYWYYKSRLNNDFVKVGTNDGESMPFNHRGNTLSNFQPANVALSLGDGTSTLGYYIAVLATEYKLLEISGQSTEKIRHELYCALNAVNRLDYKAESLWQSGVYNLNGFFIRDDVPSALLTSSGGYEHFNYFNFGSISAGTNVQSRGFMSKMECGANFISTSWIDRVETYNLYPPDIAMSQDQVYDLLFGLAFVKKFVPATATDNNGNFLYGSGQAGLKQEATNIANRIINHIRSPKDLNGNPCGNPGNNFPNNWRIRNPTTCNLVASGFTSGSNAEVFAYPLAEFQCWMNGGALLGNGSGNPSLNNPLTSCIGSGYHDFWSQTGGRVAWNLATDTYVGINWCPNSGIDDRVFITNMSAICNCVWGTVFDTFVDEIQYVLVQIPVIGGILATILGWVWQAVQIFITHFYPGYFFNNTSTSILLNAYSPGSSLDHGPLARKVLHDGYYQPNINYSIPYQLDMAPCDGLYNLGGGVKSGAYWSSDNRLDHPNRSDLNASIQGNSTCSGVDLFKGEFNAIDFMLYHNLWYLHQWQQNGLSTPFIDLSDVYINKNGGTESNSTDPLDNIIAFETITSENTTFDYSNSSPAYWCAGKFIDLKPGTEFLNNNNVHMYIEKFDCATNLGNFRIAHQDSSNAGTGQPSIHPYHSVNSNPSTDDNTPTTVNNPHFENHVTEFPVNPLDEFMKKAYPEYSRELFVKPTLTRDFTRVYFQMEENERAFITVIDLAGKIVYTKTNIGKEESGLHIDLSQYAGGVYVLKFTTTKGTQKSQKIVKE